MTVMAAGTWRNNAELMADVAILGYLEGSVLDCTYGLGRFWTVWKPEELTATDIEPGKSPTLGVSVDFCDMPFRAGRFDAVVFDPPYKLNGTGGSHASDAGYGVANTVRWQDRHDLIRRGIEECVRVLKPGGHLLVKCQDQVCSGQVRWQTREFADHAEKHGVRQCDRFDLPSYRAQPPGRRQVHARRNYSTLLVFVKEN